MTARNKTSAASSNFSVALDMVVKWSNKAQAATFTRGLVFIGKLVIFQPFPVMTKRQ